MTVLTLYDALKYQEQLLARMKNSGKATEKDLTMTRYTIDIIEDRIRQKEEQ